MSDFVIGLEHYDGVNAVRRKFRIVRENELTRNDLRQMLAFSTLLYRFYCLRVNVFSEDCAVRTDSLGCPDREPAAPSSDVRDRGSGVHAEKRKNPLGLEPRIAFRILKNRKIARVWLARWMSWRCARCSLSVCQHRGDRQQEGNEKSGGLPHRKPCNTDRGTVKVVDVPTTEEIRVLRRAKGDLFRLALRAQGPTVPLRHALSRSPDTQSLRGCYAKPQAVTPAHSRLVGR